MHAEQNTKLNSHVKSLSLDDIGKWLLFCVKKWHGNRVIDVCYSRFVALFVLIIQHRADV